MEIKYSPNVLGCRIENIIFINPNLKSGSKLHRAVLKHELKHSGRFTRGDLKLDMDGSELKDVRKEYWAFMFKHPRAMLSLLPITKVGKYWGFDIALALVWAFAIGIAVLFSLGGRI